MIESTGGLDGLRDEGMLDSAVAVAFQTFGGTELYPSTTAKIARIAYGLVCNHPFLDGNKRIGTYVMLVLLELNHIEADFSDNDIIRIGLGLADGKLSDKQLLEITLVILESSKYKLVVIFRGNKYRTRLYISLSCKLWYREFFK